MFHSCSHVKIYLFFSNTQTFTYIKSMCTEREVNLSPVHKHVNMVPAKYQVVTVSMLAV